jgi:hypothetical protein
MRKKKSTSRPVYEDVTKQILPPHGMRKMRDLREVDLIFP